MNSHSMTKANLLRDGIKTVINLMRIMKLPINIALHVNYPLQQMWPPSTSPCGSIIIVLLLHVIYIYIYIYYYPQTTPES